MNAYLTKLINVDILTCNAENIIFEGPNGEFIYCRMPTSSRLSFYK